ncbi:hypothetical protein FRB94_008426 [Tulasnella sp. JGI-2019a]|nr:hypothetical protein FRB94_008426 [Tulasnella sp. JGI-2019a]
MALDTAVSSSSPSLSTVSPVGPVHAHGSSSATGVNNISTVGDPYDRKTSAECATKYSTSLPMVDADVEKTTAIAPASFKRRTHDFGLIPIPRKQQHDPNETFEFTLKLNIVFGLASTTITANLYYCQPLLVNLAHAFHTNDSTVSTIPTLTQAGYAIGILLISPLGDLVRRRPLILIMLTLSLLLTIGIALAPNVVAFKAISFLTGIATCTPQILIPYAVDLAPSHRRASVMSIVLSGLLLGVIVARAIGGVIADVSGSWRNVYWMAVGIQSCSLVLLWWVVPDRPSKVDSIATSIDPPTNTGVAHVNGESKAPKLTYLGILRTMLKFAVTEPILIQGYLMAFGTQIIFGSFWVTLTFLLTDSYNFSTLDIGLFGLVGIVGVTTAPFVGRLVDKLVLWVGILLSTMIIILSVTILTIGGGLNIAAAVIVCIGLDLGVQLGHVAITSKIYAIDPAYRSRLNAVFVVAVFCGQVVGSAVGSKIFLTSGWRASSGASIGFGGFMLIVLLARGPHCPRYTWLGWEGGTRLTKDIPTVLLDEEKGVEAINDDKAQPDQVRGRTSTNSVSESGDLKKSGQDA